MGNVPRYVPSWVTHALWVARYAGRQRLRILALMFSLFSHLGSLLQFWTMGGLPVWHTMFNMDTLGRRGMQFIPPFYLSLSSPSKYLLSAQTLINLFKYIRFILFVGVCGLNGHAAIVRLCGVRVYVVFGHVVCCQVFWVGLWYHGSEGTPSELSGTEERGVLATLCNWGFGKMLCTRDRRIDSDATIAISIDRV